MDKKYLKKINSNIFFIENLFDKKKRHELENIIYNKDIIDEELKNNIDEIRNY
ncbi:hypothetical protein [Caminicella sporogenes]|uniref:hypothetical protein n=1 Tax=Caminicella sporogenes TaxID=166485 RepID=UPI0025409D39|nr:hypothetical protein [Caminicella sporogenes]WIF94331.1 hypothetical protein QNI18_08655 [Caminicella sporogenes]